MLQLAGIVVVGAYFAMIGAGFSAVYGGLISLVNTLLIALHTHTQKQKLNLSAIASVGLVVMSVISRMAVMIGLILIGLLLLQLNANGLIVGLVLAQIGFLIDKLTQ